jgi:serine/threonine protein kinase
MSKQTGQRREITLLQERSAGTFARVFLARERDEGGLSRIVAVKVLKERWADAKDVIARTRDEAQLLASLQHQNIVRVEAITEINGQPAIIMEFVHGIDLSQLLKALAERNQFLPARTIYEIAEGIASALAAAWFKVPIGMSEPLRVVHRDIKPSNIMVSIEGGLRVLDFGTARFEDAGRMAKTEAFRFGSLKYMSPERREGDRGDHASDIYSLGLLCIELFGGKCTTLLPMDPDGHDEVLANLVDAIPSFGLPNSGWDNSLRETLLRMCATDPAIRLDARQAVKLMRAFKEQATGDGLISFAEDTVAPIVEVVNAIPEIDPSKGIRFWVNEDTQDSEMPAETEPESITSIKPEAEAAIPDDGPTLPGTGLAPDGPTLIDEPAAAIAAGIPGAPDAAHSRKIPPLTGLHDLATEDVMVRGESSSSWIKGHAVRPVQDGPVAQANTAQPLPQTVLPTAAPSRRKMIAIGCAIGTLAFAAVSVGGFVSWKLITSRSEIVEPIPTPVVPEPTDAPAAEVDLINFDLHAGDPTVQWVRLTNAEDRRVLTARPDADELIAPGTYTISVKVVAREVLSGEIAVTEDTSISCKPATMGRIRCTEPNGSTRLLLRP